MYWWSCCSWVHMSTCAHRCAAVERSSLHAKSSACRGAAVYNNIVMVRCLRWLAALPGLEAPEFMPHPADSGITGARVSALNTVHCAKYLLKHTCVAVQKDVVSHHNIRQYGPREPTGPGTYYQRIQLEFWYPRAHENAKKDQTCCFGRGAGWQMADRPESVRSLKMLVVRCWLVDCMVMAAPRRRHAQAFAHLIILRCSHATSPCTSLLHVLIAVAVASTCSPASLSSMHCRQAAAFAPPCS